MGRIRTIKPEFFRSRSLAQCPPEARLTFAGLWTEADDHGRGRADPRLLKGAIWPLDDDITHEHVSAHIRMLTETDHIRTYEVDDEPYYEIVNWDEHQAAAYRRGNPVYPEPQPHNDVSHIRMQESADRTQMSAGTRNEEQGTGNEEKKGLDDHDYFPTRSSNGKSYTSTVATWAIDNGYDPPDTDRRSDAYRWALHVVENNLDPNGTTGRRCFTTVIREMAETICEDNLEPSAVRQLKQLVNNHGGPTTLRVIAQALDQGAGLDPEYEGDPRAVVKYAAAILRNERKAYA